MVEEIFADRAYLDDGQLVPRARPDAMIHGARPPPRPRRRDARRAGPDLGERQRLPCTIGSICVHGDGPDAVRTARFLREGCCTAATGWRPSNNFEALAARELPSRPARSRSSGTRRRRKMSNVLHIPSYLSAEHLGPWEPSWSRSTGWSLIWLPSCAPGPHLTAHARPDRQCADPPRQRRDGPFEGLPGPAQPSRGPGRAASASTRG